MKTGTLMGGAAVVLLAATAYRFFSPAGTIGTSPPSQVAPLPKDAVMSAHPRIEPALRWGGLVDDSLPREQRLELARRIDGGLSAGESAYLFEAMKHRPRPGGESAWWVVLNEIMEQMRKHGGGAEHYTGRLADLLTDAGAPEVARDYAAQHLGQWISPALPENSPGEANPVEVSRGLAALVAVIRDPSLTSTGLPGTGLLVLADLLPRMEPAVAEATWSRLDTFVGGVIEGRTNAGLPLRIAAIQAAARSGRPDFLPAVRGLLKQPGQNPSIQLSSLAALGIYGREEDRPLLAAVASSGGALQYAARAALESLDAPPAR